MKKNPSPTYSISHKLLRGTLALAQVVIARREASMAIGLLRDQVGNDAVMLEVEHTQGCRQPHRALTNQCIQQTQTMREAESLEVGERTVAIGLGGPYHRQRSEKLQGQLQFAVFSASWINSMTT